MTGRHPQASWIIPLLALLVAIGSLAVTAGTLIWKGGGRDAQFLALQKKATEDREEAKKDHEEQMKAIAEVKGQVEEATKKADRDRRFLEWFNQRLVGMETRFHVRPVPPPFTLGAPDPFAGSASGSPLGSTPHAQTPVIRPPR